MTKLSDIYQHRRWIRAERLDYVARNGMGASKHPLIGEANGRLIDPETVLIHGGVDSRFTGFKSKAIGY